MAQDKATAQPGGGPAYIIRDGMLCLIRNPQEPVAVTMTAEDWDTVRIMLQGGVSKNRTTMIWWRDFCKDKRMGAETAARYEKAALELERLAKIIEETVFPPPQKVETE